MVEKVSNNVDKNSSLDGLTTGVDLTTLQKNIEGPKNIEGTEEKDPLETLRKKLKSYAQSITDTTTLEFGEDGKLTEECKKSRQKEIAEFLERLRTFRDTTRSLLLDMTNKYKCRGWKELDSMQLKVKDAQAYETYAAIMEKTNDIIGENNYFLGSLEIVDKASYKKEFQDYERKIRKFFIAITPREYIDENVSALDPYEGKEEN